MVVRYGFTLWHSLYGPRFVPPAAYRERPSPLMGVRWPLRGPTGRGPFFGHPGVDQMVCPRVRPVRACTDGTVCARKEKSVIVDRSERERERERERDATGHPLHVCIAPLIFTCSSAMDLWCL